MTSAHLLYTEEMYKRFGYLATWVPNINLNLGDVGVMKDRVFERVTTLAQQSITFETRADPNYADYEYTSANGVKVKIKGAGEVPMAGSVISQADAGISYAFQRENAIVFQATRCREMSILDQSNLGTQILSFYEQGKWPEDYVVITNLISCQGTTILISSSSSGMIEFSIDAGLNPGRIIQIADVKTGLKVVQSSNIGVKFIAAKDLTPLFKAAGVKKRLLMKPQFIQKGEDKELSQTLAANGEKELPAVRFAEIAFDDFD
jgi:hypothetical protein